MTTPRTARRRRPLLLVVASAVLVAAALPWVLRDRHAPAAHSAAPAPVGDQVRVAARLGAAQEVLAAQLPVGAPAPSRAEPAVAAADVALGLDLLRRLHSQSTGNVSVSPMSLALALTMLQNGAGGSTLAGIRAALHTGQAGGTALDAGWSALLADWTRAAASTGFTLQSADSLWLSSGLPVRTPFMTALARYFHTGVWRVDFTKAAATAAINAWTAQQTHGRIAKLVDRLDPATQAVLANAVYFTASWAEPFDPAQTRPAPFTESDGTTATVQFMAQTANLQAAVDPAYQAVQLPYRGGRFAALAIMPTARSLVDYVRGLRPAGLQDVVDHLQSGSVELRLPRFTTSSALNLNRPLQAMGMGDAFGGAADFSALSPVGLEVSKVVQRVYLKVGEKGTEAAAATGIAMAGSGAVARGAVITLDHPFLFLIRDTRTGAILFASEIQHPQS